MNSQKMVSLNPSNNYQRIGEISISTHDQIKTKISKAQNAKSLWASLDIKKRISILQKIHKEFSNQKNEIGSIASQEMGMPASVRNKIDIDAGLNYMQGYIDNVEQWLSREIVFESKTEIHYLSFEPKGVAGISIPWNYPFCNFVWGVIQNLIVGNTVVFKHSEECPLTARLLEDIMNSSELPDGVFNAVYGSSDTGEYLMNSSLDIIYFTGSTGVGKHLYEVAAKKFIPIILELGGSAPGIVCADADISLAIESIYFNRFINSGQTCDGLKRLIVHKSRFDEVVNKLKSLVLTKKIGAAEDPLTDIGPLVAERQLIVLEDQVSDALKKGAKIITGAKRPDNLFGAYYEPTIVTQVNCDMRIWKEEVFGPVLPIVSFDTFDEAIVLANDTNFGLGGYIYTQDIDLAFGLSSKLKTGNISINGASFEIAQDAFGGYKDSGLGREHGKLGLRELCTAKVIALKK